MALKVLATPIGNLGDLSPRAAEALGAASLILCEDTRVTRKLLAALDIPAPPLLACHAHNELTVVPRVLEMLNTGASVVLVSDAGTPAISDPGSRLVAAVLADGHGVVAVPGPSALTAALSISGLARLPLHFLGFPPRKTGALDQWVVEASRLPGTLVVYESGRRLARLLDALARRMPGRDAAVCREISKLHEQVIPGQLGELRVDETRGEVVVVVGPGEAVVSEEARLDGSLKSIAGALAERWGCSRREAYNRLLALEGDPD